MTETVFNSKFYRADKRADESVAACKMFATKFDEAGMLKDVFVPPITKVTVGLPSNDLIVLMPVVGSVLLHIGNNDPLTLAPGQLYCITKSNTETIVAENVYEEDTINLFVIGIALDAPVQESFTISELQLSEKNILLSANSMAANIKVGVYDSRTKDVYKLKTSGSGLFAYVINGSFDFEERLMEYRDGLYLWDVTEVDFEALSEDAIILVIDCSPLK